MATRRRREKSSKCTSKTEQNSGKGCSQKNSSEQEPDMPTFKTEPLSDDEHEEDELKMNLESAEEEEGQTEEKINFTRLESPYLAVDRNSPFSGMSLDVLAQVASATLENEPDMPVDVPQKKLTKRSIQSLDILNLEQIRMLSDKALVNMFSEMTANEMTRNYTYTCFLMPDQCQENFTSFGNENRARLRMRSHLLGHIGELLQEANTTRGKVKFTAEPVSARHKRLAAEKIKQKKATKKQKEGNSPGKASSGSGSKVNRKDHPSKYTILKSTDKTKRIISFPKGQLINLSNFVPDNESDSLEEEDDYEEDESNTEYSRERKDDSSEESGNRKHKRTVSPTKKNIAKKFAHKQAKKSISSTSTGDPGESQGGSDITKDLSKGGKNPVQYIGEVAAHSTEKQIEENEQFILDLLSRSQPHHDHCYTTIFGKKRGIETMHYDIDTSEDEEEEYSSSRTEGVKTTYRDCASRSGPGKGEMTNTIQGDGSAGEKDVTLKVNAGLVPSAANSNIPIIRLTTRLPVAADGTPIVSAEEVVANVTQDAEDKKIAGQRPYPPMPKSELARRGKVPVPEETMSSSDEEVIQQGPSPKKKKKQPTEGSAEWERKTALKCIRELRCKKKDDRTTLVCKICKDKTFTATATLMYHYRSHAGIKPFVCLICNTTFTRQHSLNYHMLIHNNQSRFTCTNCGRKFRHPSHFKEHLRRHTGETPFHCTDCPLRFKTRNTYKRHLKTRHGKLLTANGILVMPLEEFLKVRTKPYKRISYPRSPDGGEGDDVDVDVEDISDQGSETTTVENSPFNPLLEFCTQVVSQEVG